MTLSFSLSSQTTTAIQSEPNMATYIYARHRVNFVNLIWSSLTGMLWSVFNFFNDPTLFGSRVWIFSQYGEFLFFIQHALSYVVYMRLFDSCLVNLIGEGDVNSYVVVLYQLSLSIRSRDSTPTAVNLLVKVT